MSGVPPVSQPAASGIAQQPGASAAPPQIAHMFSGLANALTPEQHRHLQQQAAEHAQRIQAGLAQPDTLRLPASIAGAPPLTATPQPAGIPQQPRPQWTPQPAVPARPAMPAGQAPGGFRPPQPQQQQQMRPPGIMQQQPQVQRQVVRAAEAVPAAKRMIKKRKAPEQQLADKVASFVPQSAMFQQLAGLEKEVDALLARKRTEASTALRDCPTVSKKLRVYLYATHSNQPDAPAAAAAAPAAASSQSAASAEARRPDGGPPAWAFRVHGRLLEPSGEAPPKGLPPAPEPFSAYLRSLRIELAAKGGGRPAEALRWSAGQHTEPAREAFEVRRLGSEAAEARVTLEVNWQPQRFRLSAALSSLVGVQSDTRARVLQAVCAYIVRQKLQDPAQPGTVRCDARLKAVLGEAALPMSGIAERLAKHLSPPPPIEMTYAIKHDGPSPSLPDCYDIDIEVPLTPRTAAQPLLDKLNTTREAEPYGTRISGLIKQINEHARRRTFLLGFSQSPADFINGLIASQARDLRTFKSEHADVASMYAPTRTELFHGKWVEDAVLKYVRSL